jgi:hypothetical protein
MKTYYGFHIANSADEPAWFHTYEAAERFAQACGFLDDTPETSEAGEFINPKDILDTPEKPWTKE